MNGDLSEFKKRPREWNWTSLNLCLTVLIAVGIALPLTYRSLGVVKEREAQEKTIAELEGKIDRARVQFRRLSREVQLAATDSEYLGTFARDHVTPGYMKPGEIIFRLPSKVGGFHR